MAHGTYSSGKKCGPFFIKKIKPITKIEDIIYSNLNKDYKVAKKYVKDISQTGINCAKLYYASKNIIIEKYISGYTVDQYINLDIEDSDKIATIKRMLDLFKLSLKNNDLRIDWNLNNFILHNGQIILIDYVPSLYLSKLGSINCDITKDLYELYCNLDIQLAGIISYSIIPFLKYNKKKLKKIYLDIFTYADNIYKIDKQKKHIFLDKLLLIENYLSSNMNKDKFINKYSNLSLSKKMKGLIR